MTKVRHVFGRVRMMHDGHEYIFEMTREHLSVRRKHARHGKQITFSELLSLTDGQFQLALENVASLASHK